ncbi:unnamed protein product [Effrenium voratum]|uniref:Pentatricopeptide repeat-containing protein, chloroplastic n=1 Tax=Effrenium voratum TaxID=2562239 RepID=A0AA36J6U5_9DINO|nr:unnamed protein product [Effrenium voratum]
MCCHPEVQQLQERMAAMEALFREGSEKEATREKKLAQFAASAERAEERHVEEMETEAEKAKNAAAQAAELHSGEVQQLKVQIAEREAAAEAAKDAAAQAVKRQKEAERVRSAEAQAWQQAEAALQRAQAEKENLQKTVEKLRAELAASSVPAEPPAPEPDFQLAELQQECAAAKEALNVEAQRASAALLRAQQAEAEAAEAGRLRAQVSELEAGLELAREAAIQADAEAAKLKDLAKTQLSVQRAPLFKGPSLENPRTPSATCGKMQPATRTPGLLDSPALAPAQVYSWKTLTAFAGRQKAILVASYHPAYLKDGSRQDRPGSGASPKAGEDSSNRRFDFGAGPPREVRSLLQRLKNKRISNAEAGENIDGFAESVTLAITLLSKRSLFEEAALLGLDACDWKNEGPSKKVPGNFIVCSAALGAARQAGNWQLALQLLQHAETASIELDAGARDEAFRALLAPSRIGSGRGGPSALQAAERLQPGLRARSAAAAELGKQQQWQVSLALLQSDLDATAWEVLLGALQGQWQVALAVLSDMEASGSVTGNGLALAALACLPQRWEAAQLLLEAAWARPEKAHEGCLTLCAMKGPGERWPWAVFLLEAMAERQQVPLTTCNAAITVCAQAKHWQRALAVLDGMLSGDRGWSTPDHISYNGALAACERAAQPELAARLLQQMLRSRTAEVSSFSSVAAAYGRTTGWQMALALCFSLNGHALQPDEAMRTAAAACGNQGFDKEAELYREAQPWQRAEQLLRGFQGATLTSCLDKGFEWARALRSLEVEEQTVGSVALKSYGAALSACQRAGDLWPQSLALLQEVSRQRVETSAIALQAALESCAGAPAAQPLLAPLRQAAQQEVDKSVLVVVSNSLEQYGCFEAALAQRLRREVLRPCVARLRFPGSAAGSAAGAASRGGPLSDTVLSAQSSLGALCPELFKQMAWQESSRGRLFARRLHLEQGTPSPERWSLSAKSIPAFVSSHLDSAITSTRGRLVGHRTVDDETFLPSVLADHDRSQHAERQALLSLVEEALDEGLDPAGLSPAGAVHLYISAYPCISCTAVFFQLSTAWPSVRLRVAFDSWEETKRWTVHREDGCEHT